MSKERLAWITRDASCETYSQKNQDKIINAVFAQIPPKNKFAVEIGFNADTLTGGSGSNTANLIINHNWTTLLIDAEYENKEINLHKHFLTSKNASQILKQHNCPKEPDYISIDIDSTDLWIMKAVLEDYKPTLMSVEYNSNFPPNLAITFPNNPQETWQNDKVFGASLKALTMVAEEFEYELVYVEKPLDAFFIRKDLNIFKKITRTHEYCNIANHKPCTTGRESIMIDYEVYKNTKNEEEARKLAEKCHPYLVS